MKLRDPESQEHFDGTRNVSGLEPFEWMPEINDEFIACRTKAADTAKEWLLKRGYFNGDLTNDLYDAGGGVAHVKVTLTCYGLPNNEDSEAIHNEIKSVLLLMDGLAEQWGDVPGPTSHSKYSEVPEEWRTVEGSDGLYEVSSYGRIRSRWLKGGDMAADRIGSGWRELGGFVLPDGYVIIVISNGTNSRRERLHCLVATQLS